MGLAESQSDENVEQQSAELSTNSQTIEVASTEPQTKDAQPEEAQPATAPAAAAPVEQSTAAEANPDDTSAEVAITEDGNTKTSDAEPAAANVATPDSTIQPVSESRTPEGPQSNEAKVVNAKAKAEAAKRKMKSNPVKSVGKAKAVPNLAADENQEQSASSSVLMDDSRKKDPVVVPKSAPTLDAELEAEIEAAMSGGELEPAGAVSTSAGDEQSGDTKTPLAEDSLEPGMRVSGKIQSIHGEDVFLDLGVRSPATVSARQFEAGKKPEVGQLIEVIIDRIDAEEGLIYANLPRGTRKLSGNWEAITVGQVVDCMVDKTNKGGLEVTVSSMRAFLPASQVDLFYVEDLKPYVGQKMRVQITDVNPKKRNLVVSRRACLIEERKEAAEELWQKIAEGDTYSAVVKNMKDYGAFLDLGGIDGFLHIGEISWSRIKHPSEVLKEGQTVDVKVIGVDREKKRISLGMRELSQNPWLEAMVKYPKGSKVTGKVVRTTNFGAFIELEPAVEGLAHISELDHKRVGRVADVLKEGQLVEAQVLEINPDRQRISLSLKALVEKPKEDKPVVEEAAPYERKRKGPLRGGNSTDKKTGSGLFGNPKDFT